MPNWQCWQRGIFGARWNMLNMRDHLSFFTEDTWRQTADKLGLDTLFVRTHEVYWEGVFAAVFFGLNLFRIKKFTKLQKIASVCPAKQLSDSAQAPANNSTTDWRAFWGQKLPAALALVSSPFTYPLQQVQSNRGRGTELSVLARR